MRYRSKKRAAQERQYKKERDKYLLVHDACEAQLDGCSFVANQIHHKKGRIGDLLLDKEYWLAVCWSCHREIEDNPKMAKERGLSLSRLKV